MASAIAVTPERLREISVRIGNGAADVKAILSRLTGNVAWVRSAWVGSARIRFDVLWDQLQMDATGLQSVLTGIAKLTENAGTASEGTEQSIARTFDEFRADLDRLSELLGPVRRNLPAPALRLETAVSLTETEADANLIDMDLVEDDFADDAGGSDEGRQERTRVPWARFMTPAAWREVEVGGND